ncbi:hypothetical protein AMEX_G25166 [Astyanax mexicanus]|uniref:Immunoglobulin domain-containing protein n=1 Tax=Astyanax mexicanus TaxID=7994 RepID=A0A8T2KPL1_ASTMX|nr:hypothetical protein AMEX_G25166 [Astyanax mexicanus]
MEFCRCVLWVLLSLISTLTAVCESAHPVVEVEFKGTAVLPCTDTCSGVIRWTPFSNSSDILAECDQTSCRSVKEGYQMIYNQYLQGNLSLIITEADFSKRGLYVCDCDGTDLCKVQLQIEPLNSTVQMMPGESLLMELDVSDPVEVIYSSSGAADGSSVQICKVERHSAQFISDYTQRVLPALELRGMKESDSGVYTVRDTLNDEIIHIYTVTVHGSGAPEQICNPPDVQSGVPVWVVVLLVLVLVAVIGMLVGVILWKLVLGRNGVNQVQMNGLDHSSDQQQRLSSSDLDQNSV